MVWSYDGYSYNPPLSTYVRLSVNPYFEYLTDSIFPSKFNQWLERRVYVHTEINTPVISPHDFIVQTDFLFFRTKKSETVVSQHDVVNSAPYILKYCVYSFRRLKKPRCREMSARSYALHSVCPRISFFFLSFISGSDSSLKDVYKSNRTKWCVSVRHDTLCMYHHKIAGLTFRVRGQWSGHRIRIISCHIKH